MERNRRTLRPSVAQTWILRKLRLAQAPFLTSKLPHQARHGHICLSKPRSNFSPSQPVPESVSLWREGKSGNPVFTGFLRYWGYLSSGPPPRHLYRLQGCCHTYSFSHHTSEGGYIFCQLRGRTALAYHHASRNWRKVLQISGCMELQTEVHCRY